MDRKLVKLFCNIKCEADCNLSENIWQTLVAQDKSTARIKLWIFSSVGLVSLVGLVPTIKILSGDLAQSGFFDYFSLLPSEFSYDGSMFSDWKEIVFSLMESLPIISVLLSLILFFIFFLSVKYATKQIGRSRLSLPI